MVVSGPFFRGFAKGIKADQSARTVSARPSGIKAMQPDSAVTGG
jgi:hypothetical protein